MLFRMELLQVEKSCKMTLYYYPDLFLATNSGRKAVASQDLPAEKD